MASKKSAALGGYAPLVAAVVVVLMVLLLSASAKKGSAPGYELSNLTKKKSEVILLEIADNDFARMRGLMFRDRIVPILFVFGYEGKFPIHSHFVKDVFDAVYVSKEGRVVEVFRRIPPNTNIVSPKKDASFLVELPCDITDRLGIDEGDLVRWTKA
jgi:uncharacterized membrane protein (UPF0127 family)